MKKDEKNTTSNSLDQRRQDANREILDLISAQVEEFPGLRLSQILRNMGVVDEVANPSCSENAGTPHVPYYVWVNEFYSEPWVILDRIKKKIKASDEAENIEVTEVNADNSETKDAVESLLDTMAKYNKKDDAT